MHKNRAMRPAHHFVGDASQDHARQASAAVGFRGDEVAAEFLGLFQDGLSGVAVFHDARLNL